MFRELIGVTALLIAIYCFTIYIRKVILCGKTEYCDAKPGISLLLLVKNQQDIIEGIIRTAFAGNCYEPIEVVAVDCGSVDQTPVILRRLSAGFHPMRLILLGEEHATHKLVQRVCRGHTVYCFDLTGAINYNLMSRTIQSILHGSRVSLYRTKVFYRDVSHGRSIHGKVAR